MRLNVFIEQTLVGVLEHEPQTNRFGFTYAPSWHGSPDGFALCPALPLLCPKGETPDSHSAAVRRFFENLLPEGHALDDAAAANKVSKANLVGLLVALGLASALKYERPYGDSRGMRHIRDGASMPRIFGLLGMTPNPAAQRLRLLRWLIFQVLIGNTDAHAKNLTFFAGIEGLSIAPAYDLVSVLALEAAPVESTYAMAVGDAFSTDEPSAFEWANFAKACGLAQRLVSNELSRLAQQTLKLLPEVKQEVLAGGALPAPVQAACEVIRTQATRQALIAGEVAKVPKRMV